MKKTGFMDFLTEGLNDFHKFIVRNLCEEEGLRSLKCFMGILIKTFLVASVISLLWLGFVWSNSPHYGPIGIQIIYLIYAAPGVFYGFILKSMMEHAKEQYAEKLACFYEDEKDAKVVLKHYRIIKKKDLSNFWHLFMGWISGCWLIVAMILPFPNPTFGFITVFGKVAFLYGAYKIFLHMQDPASGVWPLIKIPKVILDEMEKEK